MPHRNQEIVALCAACREPALATCERCDKPLCERHEPEPESRCDACEGRFLEIAPIYLPSKALSIVSNVGMVASVLGIVVVGALSLTMNIASWCLVATVLAASALYGLREFLSHREAGKLNRARKQFLLERPGDAPKQLPKRALAGSNDFDS